MLQILLGLALLGVAILGWLYYKEAKRSAENLGWAELVEQEKLIVVDFMHDMVQALGEGLSKEELFQRIAHASIVSTGALSSCVFEKTDRNLMRGVAVEGLFPPHRPIPEKVQAKLSTRAKFIESVLRSEEFPVGEGIVGKVAQTGRAEMVADGKNDPRIVKHDDPALAISSIICAPISFRNEVIGVLSVCNSSDGRPFSETDFSVVQSLAEQAGMAIHNNEFLTLLFERKQIDVDLQLARSIQLMLLPQELPEHEGVEIEARYVSSHTIGGDLYDVIELEDDVFGIAVADVSGKGIPASIVMAMCRTNLRRVATIFSSPAKTLKAVNDAIAGELREGFYITMLYSIVDLNKGEIRYARAGHESPLVCHARGESGVAEAEFPRSEGMPVGLVDPLLFDEVIEEKRLDFNQGDVFVAYTDGLTETTNSVDKEFSSARLADVVMTLRTRPVVEINDGILDSLERFSGKRQYGDDLTLVTIKRV